MSTHPDSETLLTPRQLALLRAVADGATVPEAARALALSERQARRILREIWSALGVQNRNQGLVRAGKWGLVDV